MPLRKLYEGIAVSSQCSEHVSYSSRVVCGPHPQGIARKVFQPGVPKVNFYSNSILITGMTHLA